MTDECVLLIQERGTDVEWKGGFRAVPELALKFGPRISAKTGGLGTLPEISLRSMSMVDTVLLFSKCSRFEE
jgi:hypothetical protein